MAAKRHAGSLLDYVDAQVRLLHEAAPQAMSSFDAGAIHKSRVATRRLKAGLDLLAPLVGEEALRDEARAGRRLRRRLGPLRDLDVMIGHLQALRAPPGAEAGRRWLIDRLEREREEARREVADGRAMEKAMARLADWWKVRGAADQARAAAGAALAESAHAQLESFARSAERLDAEGRAAPGLDVHDLRIAGKSLRYTLEMAEADGVRMPRAALRAFKRMQDALGLWHDHVVLCETAMRASTQTLLAHHDPDLQASVLRLAEWALRRSGARLRDFARLWRAQGQALRDLLHGALPLSRSRTDPGPPGSLQLSLPMTSRRDAAPDASASASR